MEEIINKLRESNIVLIVLKDFDSDEKMKKIIQEQIDSNNKAIEDYFKTK